MSNLSVKVSADIGDYTSNMDTVARVAESRMGQSASSVDDFRRSLLQGSADMQRAALQIGGGMEAANAAIMAASKSSEEALRKLNDTAADVDTSSIGDKIAYGIVAGVDAGIVAAQTGWEKFSEWVEEKAKLTGIVIGVLLAGTVAGAFYAAYKVVSGTIDLITGLMDGSFYKSENIDVLIASNNQLKDLQKNLGISAIEAGGLSEAMKRLGVDPGDYKAVYAGIATAIHANGEELDRLGVKYKDANGKLLENRDVLENAKGVLERYTEGWDRNQAAAAIGMGTYEQISASVKVTGQEIQKSKERLDEYQLGMSAGAQEAVTKYETAMREFNRETDLASQGFKRAIADSIMPALTDLANWFQEGWPSMVRAFRIGTSTITGLGYAMADGIYIVAQSIIASVGIIKDGVVGIATAAARILAGDVKGAGEAFANGWEKAKDRVKIAGENIVAQVMANDAKIRLATAADGRDASIIASKVTKKVLKNWTQKPDKEKESAAETVKRDPFEAELNNLGRSQAGIEFVIKNFEKFDGKVKESKSAMAEFDVTMGKFSDSQRAQENFSPLTAKQKADYIEKNRLIESGLETERQMIILSKFDKQAEQFAFKENQALEFRRQDVEWMGKGQVELAKLTEARRIDGEIAQMINATQLDLGKKGLSITQAQIDAIHARGDAAKEAAQILIQQADDKQKDPWFNMQESIRKYGEEADNVGMQIGNSMTGALKSAEDAWVKLQTTGKASFSDLAKSVIADMARMQAKAAISGLVKYLGTAAGSLFDSAGRIDEMSRLNMQAGTELAGARATGGPVWSGASFLVGEKGPEIFTPSAGGTIVPNSALSGGGQAITYAPVITIDSRTDRAEVFSLVDKAVRNGNAQLVDKLQRSGRI